MRPIHTTALVIALAIGCSTPDDLEPINELDDLSDPIAAADAPLAAQPAPSPGGAYCHVLSDCDDGNPCTTATQCIEHHCLYTNTSGPCDDGSGCTLDDVCIGGECIGSEEVVLLSGTQLPATEGWLGYGDDAATTDGSIVTVTTPIASPLYRYATYGLGLSATDLATHDLQWTLRVDSADFNPYDASAALLPHFTGWYGWGPATRAQMIAWQDDRIGWGDASAQYLVDTTLPHVYRLGINGAGEGELFVDNVLALVRPGIVIGPMVGFGDQTNDWGVDGQFEISDMRLVPNQWCKVGGPPSK